MREATSPETAPAIDWIEAIHARYSRVIVGQHLLFRRLMQALLTGNHVLIEGLPGMGKTLSVLTIARSLDASFRRIQFTPDLLPSDIVGTQIYDARTAEFRPRKGPGGGGAVTAEELSRKVRGLELRARKMSGGLISGAYHSAFKGRGIEFLDVREYVPGDDTRAIDWNVTARAGHPFVKRYSEEREETVMLLVDGSLSMRVGGAVGSHGAKHDTATEIFAILASAAVRNHDRTGLILFSKAVDVYLPPACGGAHLPRMIREVLAWQPREGGTDIARALEFLSRVRHRRTLAFLISDFLGRGFDKPLRAQAKHHELIAVPIFDPRESQLPDGGLIDFEDAETGEIWTLDTSDERTRGAYELEAWRRSEALASLFRSAGVDALRVAAGSDYLPGLIGFLRLHAKRAA